MLIYDKAIFLRWCNAFLMFLMIWKVPNHQKPWFHIGFITFFASLKIINLEAFKTVQNLDLSRGTFLHWCNAFLMNLMIWEVPKHRKPWFHIGFITFLAFLKIINNSNTSADNMRSNRCWVATAFSDSCWVANVLERLRSSRCWVASAFGTN